MYKRQYQNSVPDSLIEAAQLDGASELKIFFKVMLPLAVPTVATISLFTVSYTHLNIEPHGCKNTFRIPAHAVQEMKEQKQIKMD